MRKDQPGKSMRPAMPQLRFLLKRLKNLRNEHGRPKREFNRFELPTMHSTLKLVRLTDLLVRSPVEQKQKSSNAVVSALCTGILHRHFRTTNSTREIHLPQTNRPTMNAPLTRISAGLYFATGLP